MQCANWALLKVYTIPRIETLIQGQPFGRTEIPATSVDEFVRNQSEPSTTNRLNAMPRNDSSTTAQSHTLSWHDEPIKGLYYYPLEGPAAGLETRFHVITNHSMERILVTYPYNNSVDNLSEGMRLKAQESLQLRLEFCARGGPPDNATSITVAIPFPLGKYGVATLASYLGACILSLVKLAGLGLIWALWLWFWCDRLFGYVDGI